MNVNKFVSSRLNELEFVYAHHYEVCNINQFSTLAEGPNSIGRAASPSLAHKTQASLESMMMMMMIGGSKFVNHG